MRIVDDDLLAGVHIVDHTVHVMEQSVGRVGVLDKTVAILDALEEGPLGLSDLARRVDEPRPSVHRLCAALESHGLIERDGELRQLGPRLARWANHAFASEHRLIELAMPYLETLRDATGESVQLYVRDGNERRCIAGLESLHGLRTIVRVGSVLPLDVGSAGAVLRSDDIEWKQSVEEREKGVASVSAPVVASGRVIAAVSVSGPIDRTTRQPGRRYAKDVMRAATAVSTALN
jgi:DNA-binding IclR family transcriptional regulator